MKEGDVVEYKGSEWTIIGNSVDKIPKEIWIEQFHKLSDGNFIHNSEIVSKDLVRKIFKCLD